MTSPTNAMANKKAALKAHKNLPDQRASGTYAAAYTKLERIIPPDAGEGGKGKRSSLDDAGRRHGRRRVEGLVRGVRVVEARLGRRREADLGRAPGAEAVGDALDRVLRDEVRPRGRRPAEAPIHQTVQRVL